MALGPLRRIGTGRAAHIAKHGITPEEVQRAWDGTPRPYARRGRSQDLPRLEVLVRVPLSGRILFVVVEKWPDGGLKVITARDATLSEKRLYLRRS